MDIRFGAEMSGLVEFLFPILRHPREGGDPYRLTVRLHLGPVWLWIPAFAGMTIG